MTPPIRPEIHVLVDYTDPEKFTLRAAVEWYKVLARANFGVLTALEVNYMNDRWGELCKAIASREGIPAGWISYTLSELAQTEINLLNTAEQEAEAAYLYGVNG